MSRSYKKTAGAFYGNASVKQYAKRQVRRLSLRATPVDGGQHKKHHSERGIYKALYSMYFTNAAIVASISVKRRHKVTRK